MPHSDGSRFPRLALNVRQQFKKRLAERLDASGNEASRLSGMADCYKIKLRAAGYRLVYRVDDDVVTVVVVAVGGATATWFTKRLPDASERWPPLPAGERQRRLGSLLPSRSGEGPRACRTAAPLRSARR